MAEESVRDIFSTAISIYRDPDSVENVYDLYNLEKVRINTFVLRGKLNEIKGELKLWKLEDSNIISDDEASISPRRIFDSNEIVPGDFYLVSPENVAYCSDIGVEFRKGDTEFKILEERNGNEYKEIKYKKETWVNHAANTSKVFEDIIFPRYKFSITKFAEAWNINRKEFIEKLKLIMLLHDLGKLNIAWQEKIGWNGEIPLAHSDIGQRIGIPHSTVTAVALSPLLIEWGRNFGKVCYLSLAHHHKVGACKSCKFKLVKLKKCLKELALEKFSSKIEIKGRSNPSVKMPEMITQPKSYRTYAFISRLLRLSDQIATGGDETAIFYLKNRF